MTAPRRRIRTIKLDDLNANPERTGRAARQPGGVQVVDADGRHIFRLVIPCSPLPD